jgi:hypothetical protein
MRPAPIAALPQRVILAAYMAYLIVDEVYVGLSTKR